MSNGVVRTHHLCPVNRSMMETKLQHIADKARRDPDCKFTSLFHLMNVEMLRECFGRLRKDAAAGIDQVTKEALLFISLWDVDPAEVYPIRVEQIDCSAIALVGVDVSGLIGWVALVSVNDGTGEIKGESDSLPTAGAHGPYRDRRIRCGSRGV